jgi:hypothetical protein
MDLGPPSERLARYLAHVQERTARTVSIEPYEGAGPTDNPRASLELGPGIADIEIRFRPIRPLSNPETEKQIAHELTHALMVYAQGYEIPCAPTEVPQFSVQTVAEIVDLVDDVIVDVTIHDLGFQIVTSDHLARYEEMALVLQTATSRSQIDPFEDDPIRVEIGLVSDYIYAWAVPRYADVGNQARALYARFTRRFPQIMKVEFAKARRIKKLMNANNIFTHEGRTQVVVGATDLWPVDQRIYLSSIAAA